MGRSGLRAAALLLSLMTLPMGCRQTPTTSAGGPVLRVCLLQNVEHVNVSAAAPVLAKSSGESQSRRLNFPKGGAVPVLLSADGWHVGNISMSAGELRLIPPFDGAISVEGRKYRGEYRLVPGAAGKFDVVNDVPMEAYLKGVLPGELPKAWHIEAYKAQAVAARTYALYEMKTRSSAQPFDVFDDTRSQVYDGMDGESSKSQAAVDETGGIVLAYAPPGGSLHIFHAYFSSCCGGAGQSVTDAFNEESIPPLTEQRVGGMCNASPRFNWAPVVLSKAELTRRVRAFGARRGRPEKDIATLERIDIAAMNQFGRPVRFILTDSRGTKFNLSGEETRVACNADAKGGPILLSSFFKPVNDSDSVHFTDGHGFGHGVGLCQWCAEARAEQGTRHEDILLLAYPHATLIRAY